jgi:hypothetical protein
VRVVPTYILENEGLRLMKEKDAAQQVVFADIVNDVRSGAGIPDGDAEMMIPETSVLPQVGLGSGKGKNAGFPIMAYLIVLEGRPTVGSIDDCSG